MNSIDDDPPIGDSAETPLDEALVRVTHGATVSLPAILLQKGLGFAFSAILTNGFAARSFGLFVLADRLQNYLAGFSLGFKSGLNRFLPQASPVERDLYVTFASLLMLFVATLFGVGLFLIAPFVTHVAGHGPQFLLFVRVFAMGLPLIVWSRIVIEILRGLEEVGPLNLLSRVGIPTAELGVVSLGTFVFHDLIFIAGGIILTTGLIGVVVVGWLVHKQGLRLRIHGEGAAQLRIRYIRFTAPLFVRRLASITHILGYYPLIAIFLSGVAGGVFAIGVLVGSFVQLPLIAFKQFTPPVAASLYEGNHHEDLYRLYQVTSRLVFIGATALVIPLIIYRTTVMNFFNATFVKYASLLPGFIAAKYIQCATGNATDFLRMTDHPQALLVVDIAVSILLIVTAIPLTLTFDLSGLVISYVLIAVVENVLLIIALYHLENLQPFTRMHTKPLLAAIPLLLASLASRIALPTVVAPLIGSLFGLTLYVGTLKILGFTQIEHRLASSLVGRYEEIVPNINYRTPIQLPRKLNRVLIYFGVLAIVAGFAQSFTTGTLIFLSLLGIFAVIGGSLLLVVGLLGDLPVNHRLSRVLYSLIFMGSGLMCLWPLIIR